MEGLIKGDPVYYKVALQELLDEAVKEGLKLALYVNQADDIVQILFNDEISDETTMAEFNTADILVI